MGGGYRRARSARRCPWGLSPHGRGIRESEVRQHHVRGPIPAWAGDTACRPRRGRAPRAYPRMGGGYSSSPTTGRSMRGLSPHGRGILVGSVVTVGEVGPIPAWAGDTQLGRGLGAHRGAYPRMGGGYERKNRWVVVIGGLSPHGRGIPFFDGDRSHGVGPIPAWAGDTEVDDADLRADRAYPRMGGGYAHLPRLRAGARGLSPHGRGIHDDADRRCIR